MIAIRTMLLATVTLACTAFLRRRWVIVRVVGESMSPTLTSGQRLIMRRRGQRMAELGDVIAFHTPAHIAQPPAFRVKRVVAVAGDPMPSWLHATRSDDSLALVPTGFVAVRGDAKKTEDSRHLGLIPAESIIGYLPRM